MLRQSLKWQQKVVLFQFICENPVSRFGLPACHSGMGTATQSWRKVAGVCYRARLFRENRAAAKRNRLAALEQDGKLHEAEALRVELRGSTSARCCLLN